MACANWSASTATSIACTSSSSTMDATSAGCKALITNCTGLSSHNTISTRSPPNSAVTAWTRVPRIPTHAPTGSMRWSLVLTAILARTPGSRAAPLISIISSPISGTSLWNKEISISGQVRDNNNCAPRPSLFTAYKIQLTRSFTLKFSLGIIWSRAK